MSVSNLTYHRNLRARQLTSIPESPVARRHRRGVLDAGRFSLTEACYPAGARLDCHAHALPVLAFIVRGEVRQQFGSRVWTCTPWTVVSLPAGEPHTDWYPAPGAHCLIVGPSTDHTGAAPSFVPGGDVPSCLSSPTISGLALRLHRELRHPDSVTPLAVESLVLESIAQVVRQQPVLDHHEPDWLERVRDMMHADFRRTLKITELADVAGVHPVYLARAFRRFHRCGPAEYLRGLRVEAACRALSSTETPLAQIATTNGFNDQSHLTHVFRRVVGLSPGQFRSETRTVS